MIYKSEFESMFRNQNNETVNSKFGAPNPNQIFKFKMKRFKSSNWSREIGM